MSPHRRVHSVHPVHPVHLVAVSKTAFALLVLAVVGWRSLNFVSAQRPGIDSGMFASAALHLLEGKTLYKDTWDNKQPVVYAVNAAAMALGDRTIDSIRTVERLFTVAGCVFAFFIVRSIFANGWLAFASALAFPMVLHLEPVFQGGNLTEEYGVVFVLAGVLSALASRNANRRRSLLWCGASGLAFSLAVFTKEPFLFSSIPWFAYLAMANSGTRVPPANHGQDSHATHGQDARPAVRAGFFLLAAALPALCVVGYVATRGAWSDWLDATSYNLAYARHLTESVPFPTRLLRGLGNVSRILISQTWTGEGLLILGLVGACARDFSKRYGHVPRVAAAALACDLAGVLTSSVPDGHYCMQIVPSFLLLAATGAVFLGSLFRHRRFPRYAPPYAWAIAAGALCLVLDFGVVSRYARDLMRPSQRAAIADVSRYVRDNTHETDTVWAAVRGDSALYLETGRLSPTPFFFTFKHHFLDTRRSTGREKLERLKTDLRRTPPKFILVGETDFLEESGVMRWIREDYVRVAPFTNGAGSGLWTRRREQSTVNSEQ